MPIVLVHGITVRSTAHDELETKVRLGARKSSRASSNMYFSSYFWGGDAAELRWGGASIPGFSESAQLKQLVEYDKRNPVPDLKSLLLMSPLAELDSYRGSESNASLSLRDPSVERNQILRSHETLLVNRMGTEFPGNNVEEMVRATIAAAIDTGPDIEIPDLRSLMANALTAMVCRRTSLPSQDLSLDSAWNSTLPQVQAIIDAEFGQQAPLGRLLRSTGLSIATFILRHGMRERLMPPFVRFLGDTLTYVSDRGRFLEGLHRRVIEAKNAESNSSPLWLVGHSLGGVICFDYCSCGRFPVSDLKLVTVGSQVGLFAESNLLAQPFEPERGQPRPIPGGVSHWINVWDPSDMLSFLVDPVFSANADVKCESHLPFPDSHGAYWDSDDVFDRVFN